MRVDASAHGPEFDEPECVAEVFDLGDLFHEVLRALEPVETVLRVDAQPPEQSLILYYFVNRFLGLQDLRVDRRIQQVYLESVKLHFYNRHSRINHVHHILCALYLVVEYFDEISKEVVFGDVGREQAD